MLGSEITGHCFPHYTLRDRNLDAFLENFKIITFCGAMPHLHCITVHCLRSHASKNGSTFELALSWKLYAVLIFLSVYCSLQNGFYIVTNLLVPNAAALADMKRAQYLIPVSLERVSSGLSTYRCHQVGEQARNNIIASKYCKI